MGGGRLLGIDVSGSADEWKPGRRISTVWIAFARADGPRLVIEDLRPVQALEGAGAPFERLIALLAEPGAVAAIGAPFSVPRARAPSATLLWTEAASLAGPGRPFGQGSELIAALAPSAGRNGLKAYRACETGWRKQGLDVRSSLWCGPGAGAGAAVACMTLLHRHKGPIWPFRSDGQGALLAEAYPPAQLTAWGLVAAGYSGRKPKAATARLKILEGLARRHGLRASDELLRLCAVSADALDAVICAYAAKAVAEGRHPRRLPAVARSEGWIVVDDPDQPDGPAPRPSSDAPLVGPSAERRVRRLFASVRGAGAAGGAGS